MPNRQGAMTLPQVYYALFVLWLIHLIASIDRYSIGIVLQAVKVDLELTDTELGIVSGTAFTVAFVLFGFPLARALDRGARRKILAWSVAGWSVMAIASGAAVSFLQMVLARAGLGAGQSACVPGAMSLIRDYFPQHKRTQAAGIFNSALAAAGIFGTPIVGLLTDLHGWRVAFIAFGVLGILIAIVVGRTLQEPVRIKEVGGDGNERSEKMTVRRALRIMIGNRAYRCLLLSLGLNGIAIDAWVSWFPVSLVRSYGMSYTEVGTFIGTWLGIIMVVGSIASGYFCPAVVRRTGNERWMAILPAIFCLLSVPAFAVTGLDVPQWAAMTASAVVLFLALATMPPALTLSMQLVPTSVHSIAVLVFMIVTNNIGSAIGPILVGWLSDSVVASVGEAAALRHGLLLTAPILSLAGGLLCLYSTHYIPRRFSVTA